MVFRSYDKEGLVKARRLEHGSMRYSAIGLVLWGVFWLSTVLVGQVTASVFTIPESQLLESTEYGIAAWGPGTLVSRAEGPGESVDFEFAGLGGSGTGVKDNYPVATVYGQVIPSHGNGDFSGFTGYGLSIKNLDNEAIWIQLILNTGFTGPSGVPSGDLTNNTFWTSYPSWTHLGPGDSLVLNLDFDYAVAYQISDNKVPHTGGGENWPDGGVYAINDFDRAEVSSIGFEIADFSGENPEAVIRITPETTELAGMEEGLSPGMADPRIDVFPNPGAAVTVRVLLPAGARTAAGPVIAEVYDISGRLVRKLKSRSSDQDFFDYVWDGTDRAGRSCRAGVYFVRVETADFSQSRKIILPE
jgi:hypothetical protein